MAYDIQVRPQRWTPKGETIVESKGRTPLMVWSGIPGELSTVKVVHEGRNLTRALWVRAKDRSPHRVTPPCDRYEACGGCALMHLNAEGQEAVRRDLVGVALREEGMGSVHLGAFHSCPVGFEDFRYVVKLGIDHSPSNKIRVGAWGRRDRRVVPIPKCHVAAPVLNKTMKSLAHHIIDLDIHPYDFEVDKGVLRAVVLRASRTTNEVMITLVAGRWTKVLRDLAAKVAQAVSEVAGIWVHLNDTNSNAIFVHDPETGRVGVKPLEGKETIEETIGGVTYRIGPGDFFQTNPAIADRLYARTIERLELTENDSVVDLYCGVGGFALQAAQKAGFVVGVEEVDGAVIRARNAARYNRLNAEFHSGLVSEILPELAKRLRGVGPIVTVNPARRGLEPGVVEQIMALAPKRVAYVSCHPKTLARDLRAFRDAGMDIGDIEMFDMFPNTPHVECLVTMDAPPDGGPTRRAPRRKVVR